MGYIARILYIDDDPDIRDIVQMALELSGDIEVAVAATGEEGLALVHGWHPDLVMLDVSLPGVDGPAIFQQIRADAATASVPIAFVTARTQPDDVAALHALGACCVIAKPFDPLTLARQACGCIVR
ncbi:response regulator [Aquisediminimonas sediminicola]|uniref:response regulator n=1 Tax=Alteraquisediminimonas sediminicola TaxID=2676787 RepID=UPI001C8DA18E|nr:response regulator [Aquisediminimonas sediminicola]